jgi:hypothetical protein
MHVDQLGGTLQVPFATCVLEIADQLFLLGADRDEGSS